jgi:hypothetical protein
MPQEYKGPRGEQAREYGRRSTQGYKIYLALRWTEAGEAEWVAVRGISCKVADWPDLKLFTYRVGLVAFIVELKTGITLAVGSTTVKALGHLRAWLADKDKRELRAELFLLRRQLGVGPRPKVKFKEKNED